MDHATRVLDMRATDPSEGSNYGWLSDYELLYFRQDGNLWRRDVNSDTETVLPALTRQVKRSIPFQTAHWLVPSPDGKWVLWGQSSNNPLFVASVDGAKRYSWPGFEGCSSPYWLPDSQQWSQWVFGNHAHWTQVNLHNVSTPHQSQSLNAPPMGLRDLDILSVQSEDIIVAKTRDVHTSGKAIRTGADTFAFASHIAYRDTQELSIWSLHAQQPLKQFTIRLPGLVRDVKVAPQGDRLAWLIQTQTASPLLKLVQRFLPKGVEIGTPIALYVSQLDGSRLHEIGQLNSGFIGQMRWLPGGKSLSFIANDALWTVPVE